MSRDEDEKEIVWRVRFPFDNGGFTCKAPDVQTLLYKFFAAKCGVSFAAKCGVSHVGLITSIERIAVIDK